MKYGTQAVSKFARDFLIGTSQGITCLVFCCLYVVAELVAWLAPRDANPFLRIGSGFILLIPLLLVAFTAYATSFGGTQDVRPESSAVDTVFVAILGALPFVLVGLHAA